MWSFGPHNSSHFLKDQVREHLFREAVITFFTGGKEGETAVKTDPLSIYCQSCKQANKNVDCSKCDRKIEVKKDG